MIFKMKFLVLYNPNKVLLFFSKFREISENVSIFPVSIFPGELYLKFKNELIYTTYDRDEFGDFKRFSYY